MNILMVGCGKMGGAMLNRWAEAGVHSFTVIDPAEITVPAGVRHLQSSEALADEAFDMLVIAVKPQMIAEVIPPYISRVTADGAFVSIAAGTSLKSLTTLIGDKAIVRAMPNLPAMIGAGVTGLYANQQCGSPLKDTVTELMQAVGITVWLDSEDEIDRLTAVSGSGPGYVFQMMESYVKAAQNLGFSESTARKLVTHTIAGATLMADQTNESLAGLRTSVTSKKGTTEAGLSVLREGDVMDKLFDATTLAAYRRAVELR